MDSQVLAALCEWRDACDAIVNEPDARKLTSRHYEHKRRTEAALLALARQLPETA